MSEPSELILITGGARSGKSDCAERAGRVYLMVSGLPVELRSIASPWPGASDGSDGGPTDGSGGGG
jgi:hypothetical protein